MRYNACAWFEVMWATCARTDHCADFLHVLVAASAGVSADMRRFLAEALPSIMRDILHGVCTLSLTGICCWVCVR